MNITVTQQEFDTILAALRAYQAAEHAWPGIIPSPTWELASEHGTPLDDMGIDELIERIN